MIESTGPAMPPLTEAQHSRQSEGPVPPGESLLAKFNLYFETVTARTEEQIQQAQRIRYQVYCVENRYEDPAEHPDGLERDAYDAHSIHSLLIHRPSGKAMGTTRLILPVRGRQDRSFPIQQVCDHPMLNWLALQPTAEVSRFSISKEFRRRKNDTQYEGRPSPNEAPGENRSAASLMSLGLIQSLVRMSAESGVTFWCATMEPRLLRFLSTMSISFEPLGPLVEYHGLRQPCYCDVASMLRQVKDRQPALWEILTDGGPPVQGAQLAA